MDQQALENELSDLAISGIKYYETTPSTNDEAAEWAGLGAGDFSVVVADEQLQGRGRQGRSWITTPGAALAFSLILIPTREEITKSKSNFTHFTGIGALGICSVLRNHYCLPTEIKWPNDVLVRGKKVCGVLVESQWIGEDLSSIVLGIGINIAPESIPADIHLRTPATCLETEVGHAIKRTTLLRQFLVEINTWRTRIFKEDFIRTWEANLAFMGKDIKIKLAASQDEPDSGIIVGRLSGLDMNGRLLLRTWKGKDITIHKEVISIELVTPKN